MFDLSSIPLMFFSLFGGEEMRTERVEISGPVSITAYHVEIADTPFHHLKGLMHRRTIPTNGGMLFIYDEQRSVQMWMKNVAFTLDMLFVDQCGMIVEIRHQAQPNDSTVIASSVPVRAVLELPGGASKRAQIRPGAQISWNGADQVFQQC